MNPEQSLAAGCIPAFRFYLQAPGPDFAVVDCCRIFNDDTGYQAWVEALAPWLEVVSCTVCSVGHSFGQWLGLSFPLPRSLLPSRTRQNPGRQLSIDCWPTSRPMLSCPKRRPKQCCQDQCFSTFRGHLWHPQAFYAAYWLASAFRIVQTSAADFLGVRRCRSRGTNTLASAAVCVCVSVPV